MTPAASLIPPFDWQRIVVDPWTEHMPGTLWMVLMAALLGVPCALLGNCLILRRMALTGDAISHSVLPGLVLAYLVFRNLGTGAMLAGAMLAGLVTTLLIEFITSGSRLKSDAATGITYTTLFALGIFLVNRYAGRIHLDADCVLFGELEYIPLAEPSRLIAGAWGPVPVPLLIGTAIAAAVLIYITAFYKELKLTAFDPGLARSLGIRTRLTHYSLMAMLSVVVVSSLESVGLLVVALLVLPGSTAQFFTRRLLTLHILSVILCLTAVLGGYHLAAWFRCPTAAAIALCGGAQFAAAWICFLLPSWFRTWTTGALSGGMPPQNSRS
jgi:manganese/zinc/iron transport system permease protein